VKIDSFLDHFDDDFDHMNWVHNAAECSWAEIINFKFLSIEWIWRVCGGTSHNLRNVNRIKRRIATMYSIISTFPFLYTTLQFIYYTFMHNCFSHSFNSFIDITCQLIYYDMKVPHFSSCSDFCQLQEKQRIYLERPCRWRSQHDSW